MSRVYLDTNVFIYAFDGHEVFGKLAGDLLERLSSSRHTLLSSLFTLGEILVKPVRLGDEFSIARLNGFFLSSAVSLVSFPTSAVSMYAQLRARQRIKPFDALHLACAAHAGVDSFHHKRSTSRGLEGSRHRGSRRTRHSLLACRTTITGRCP